MRKRHIETQIYVGAFQYLSWKQLNHDTMLNENNNKTKALQYLLILAKNLLCEIETAINNTGMKMPMIFSRDAMHNRMTFRNNNRDRKSSVEVDEIDSKFAKIRFSEYLHGLQMVLKNRMGKRHMGKKQRKVPMLKKRVGPKNTAVRPIAVPKINQPTENEVDSSFLARKHSLHHNNRQNHRNRYSHGKLHRHRRPLQNEVVGVGPTELRNFRRFQRKSTISPATPQSRISSTIVAPHS